MKTGPGDLCLTRFFDHAGLISFPAILPPLPSCGLVIFSQSMGNRELWATNVIFERCPTSSNKPQAPLPLIFTMLATPTKAYKINHIVTNLHGCIYLLETVAGIALTSQKNDTGSSVVCVVR